MTRQLILDLPVRQALGREDFFVAPSNSNALNTLDSTAQWPLGKMVLCGDSGAGKTHLVHVWTIETGGDVVDAKDLPNADIAQLAQGHVAVEDADAIAGNEEAERALFHLHNLVLAQGNLLLLTAKSAPSRWGLTLPDLKSRMEGSAITRIEAPDDMLLTVVLLKHFADRQLHVAPEVVDYIIKRIPRSLEFTRDLCLLLDETGLAEQRAITRPFAAKVLDLLDNNPSREA
jgi:chromosomal replication initiation ATPase DnaA